MTAWTLRAFGPPDGFERTEIGVAALRPGHVLIRVAATSVNAADLKIRDGRSAAIAPPAPMVLHMDVAGTVVAVADDVTTLAPGDHVLVHGGTGGVGHIAVQLAKADGAHVTTPVP